MAALPTSPLQAFFGRFLKEVAENHRAIIQQNGGYLVSRPGQIYCPAHTDPQATGFGENQKVASNASVSTEAISQGSSEDGIWLSQSASGMQVSSRGPSEHAVWPSPVPAGT